MKLNIKIMPEFHLNKTEDDMKDEFKSFYTGKNKFEGFIVDNTLYFVSFFIPVILLLLMMNYFGFAPFGKNCMFVLDGATNNLPVLTKTIAQLRTGTFHLFTLSGSIGNEIISSFAYYLASPFTLITLLFPQELAVGLLSLFCVLRISLSAPIFLYYLTHRRLGRKGSKFDVTLLIFALGYAMSSYALVQFSDFMYLDCFMLFPLLMLGLERIIKKESSRLFYTTLVICLFSNYYMGLILILFSILYYFFMHTESFTQAICAFPKMLGVCLLAVCTSAITVFPGISGMYHSIISQTKLESFSLFQNYFQLFLQHFFYNDPSYLRVVDYGSNLYIGIIILPLVCLHFLDETISLKKRFTDLLFIVLLILSLNYSPVSYFFHLGISTERSFTGYAFIYLFILLFWAFDTFRNIRSISLWRNIIALIIPISFGLLAMNFARPLPNFESVNYSIDIMIVLAILLILYRLGSIKRSVFYTITTVVVLLELMANSFQYVYMTSLEEVKVSSVLTQETPDITQGSISDGRSEVFANVYTDDVNMNHLFSRYSMNAFLSRYDESENTPFEDSLASLKYLYFTKAKNNEPNPIQYEKVNEDENYTVYQNKYAFPTAYMIDETEGNSLDISTPVAKMNSLAKQLGAPRDIYREVPLNIEAEIVQSETANVYNLGNQMFALSKEYDASQDPSKYPSLYRVKFNFTAPETGELYLFFNNLSYYDSVKENEEYTFSYYDSLLSDLDRVVMLKGYYLDLDALQALYDKISNSACSVSQKSLNQIQINTNSISNQTMLSLLPYTKNYIVKVDGQNAAYHEVNNQLAVSVPAGKHMITVSYRMVSLYMGILFSFLTTLFMFILTANTAFLAFLRKHGHKVNSIYQYTVQKVAIWASDNYVYLLSFFIPFITFILIMIKMGATPFGPYSIFSDDGQQIVLPSLHAAIAHIRSGNSMHTWIGGAGRYYSPQKHPVFALFSFSALNTIVPLFTVFMLSLSGFSLTFYLTHRLNGKRAYKRDPRLLIAALTYSMSNFSLLMINNYGWYYAFVLFPLILLGMDYLMMKGKKRYFIFFLALSITLQSYMSMFICFYLVLRFFTYPFASFKDFMKKGIRFALSALTMVAICYKTIFGTVTMLSTSNYGNDYSKEGFRMPVSEWFTNWSYFIKQQMILPENFTISWNEGDANLYFGILIVILLILYLFAKKVSWKDKLHQLLPFCILYLTLNQSVMNYILNGLHYQNGVPNRFVFLITLIAGVIGYDSLCVIDKQNIFSLLASILVAGGLFTYAYITNDHTEVLNKSFYVTIALCALYLVIFLFVRYGKKNKRLLQSGIVLIFCLEIVVNAFFTVSEHKQVADILSYSKEASDYLKNYKQLNQTLERVSQHSPLTEGYALVDQVKSNHLFAVGSINSYQQNAVSFFGVSTGDNILSTTNSQTLMGESFGCNRYIMINNVGEFAYGYDLDHYNLIALTDNDFILENPYCFPFAYYLSNELIEEQKTSTTPYDVWQSISYYMNPDADVMVMPYPIYKKEDLPEYEANYYTEVYTDDKKIEKMHLEIPYSGDVYLQISDFQYLGYHEAGETLEFDFDATGYHSGEFPNPAVMCIMDREVFKELYTVINQNALKITSFSDTTIDGTMSMPDDGVINFSMPYDANWKAYIDGKETETIAHADAFLAVPATKGDHEVHLEYVVKKNIKPTIIFYASWTVFFLCVIGSDIYRKKRKKSSVSQDMPSEDALLEDIINSDDSSSNSQIISEQVPDDSLQENNDYNIETETYHIEEK